MNHYYLNSNKVEKNKILGNSGANFWIRGIHKASAILDDKNGPSKPPNIRESFYEYTRFSFTFFDLKHYSLLLKFTYSSLKSLLQISPSASPIFSSKEIVNSLDETISFQLVLFSIKGMPLRSTGVSL